MKLVSVILPYYKKKNYVRETIQSIVFQNYKNLEIIIIDDELSSESDEILSNLSSLDDRIVVLKNSKNLGAGLSRNKGIKYSNGEYIAFCDWDDIWQVNKISEQIKFMENNSINASFTSYNIVDKFNNIIGLRKAKERINFKKLQKSCDIGMSTVILEKSLINNTKIFFPSIKTKEDYVFWLKLSLRGVIFFGLNKTLSSWRKTEHSLSSNFIQKIFDGYKVYRIYLGYNFFKSVYRLLILSINFLLKNKYDF